MTSNVTTPPRAPSTPTQAMPKRSLRYHHHLFLFQCNHASSLRTELAEISVHRVLSKRNSKAGEDA